MLHDQLDPGVAARLGDDLLVESVQRTIEPRLFAIIKEFGDAELVSLGIEAPLSMTDPRIVGFLVEQSALRSVGINETTKRKLSGQLADAIIAGESISSVRSRISEYFTQAAVSRSMMISRTTVNAAANLGVMLAHQQSGRVATRMWVTTRDRHTRDTHFSLHGQVRSVTRPFEIPLTGRKAMYPGGFGVPSEDIHCRCTTVPLARSRSDGEDGGGGGLDSFWDRVRVWEAILARDMAELFIAQGNLVLGGITSER